MKSPAMFGYSTATRTPDRSMASRRASRSYVAGWASTRRGGADGKGSSHPHLDGSLLVQRSGGSVKCVSVSTMTACSGMGHLLRSKLTAIHAKVPPEMGPLSSLRIIELAGLGPGPFCGMMLSDLGADV